MYWSNIDLFIHDVARCLIFCSQQNKTIVINKNCSYRSNDVLRPNAVTAGGMTAERFDQLQAMQLNPFGFHFDAVYIDKLYEVLMESIGKTGTFENFQLNINNMNQIVVNHYVKDICIRDLSDEYNAERAELFLPIFETSFNKTGV